MPHANARLTPHDRLLLVQQVLIDGRPVTKVAAEFGISRPVAHRWIRRYRDEGIAGLVDRPSRPHRSPRRTPAEVEASVIDLRRSTRRGPVWISRQLGVPTRTVSAILRRHAEQMPEGH